MSHPQIITQFDLSKTDMVYVTYNEVDDATGRWEDVKQKVKDEFPMTITHLIKKSHIKFYQLKELV